MPDAFEWGVFVFAIFTVLIYCLMLSVIRDVASHEKKSNASFYLICEVVGYVDVVCLLNNYLTYQWPKWAWFTAVYLSIGTPLLLRIGFFITWGSGVAQVHSTLLLAYNRFTAVVFPGRHDQLWRRSSRIWIYVFILVPATVLASATFFSPVAYETLEDGVCKNLTHLYYGLVAVFMVVYSAIISGQYAWILFSLRKHQKRTVWMTSAITTSYLNRATLHRKREQRLLLMSVLVCTVQLVLTTYIILKYTMSSSGFDSTLNLYNFLDTLYSGINPYLLFGFSDVLRRRMISRALSCFRCLFFSGSKPLQPVVAFSAKSTAFKKSVTIT